MRAYSRPITANCRSHSAVQSTVAPPSTRICGARPGTGIGTAIAGRAAPLMRPMRSNAAAMDAPVLPALVIASALPSRTSSALTTIDESLRVRTAAGGSCIATISVACTTSTPLTPEGTSGAIVSSMPTSSTRTSSSSAACTAPATISPGARSPPIASTATVMGTGVLLDVDDLAAAVRATVATNDVRLLHGAAIGARGAGGRGQLPVGGASLTRLRPGGLALRDCHFGCSCLLREFEIGERGPSRIGRRLVGRVIVGAGEHGRRLGGLAVGTVARRREGQLQHERVAHELLEVELVALDGVGVTVDGVGFVELGDTDGEVGGELAEARAALSVPTSVQLTPRHDPVRNALQHEVEADRLDDARDRRAEVVERSLQVQGTARAGMRQEICDVDAECTHGPACEHGIPAGFGGGKVPGEEGDEAVRRPVRAGERG